MKYVIGIDGGGTSSTLRILDEQGTELGSGVGGPTNMSAQPVEEVRNTLDNLIIGSIEHAGLSIGECNALCIGTAGAGRAYQSTILKGIIKDIGIKKNVIVRNDADIALVAGAGKEEGIIVIAGTGSIAYGSTLEGKSYRTGGWGHIVGDEGSAYYIGARALTEALRSYDGRRESTLLLPMLMDAINVDDVDYMIKYIYDDGFSKTKIAKLAKVVDEAYKKGDQTAKEILSDGSYELFLLADAVVRKLGFNDITTTLVTSGSVLLKNDFVFKNFERYVEQNYPKLQIVKLDKDAAYGAAYIALQSLHVYS